MALWLYLLLSVGPPQIGAIMPAEYTVFNSLYSEFMFWSIVVGVFTFAWMTYTLLVHRKGLVSEKTLEKLTPGVFPKERDNLKLELTWVIAPSILVAWLVWLAWQSLVGSWGTIPDTQAEDTFEMELVGYQWFWEFTYVENLEWDAEGAAPDGTITFTNGTDGVLVWILDDVATTYGASGQLVVVLSDLADQPYNLTSDGVMVGDIGAKGHPYRMGEHSVITVKVIVEDGEDIILAERHHISAGHVNVGEAWIPNNNDILYQMTTEDTGEHPAVLHAPFLSEWGVKEDVSPGIWTIMYFHPQETGTFELTCTEFCGLQHSLMIATVHVVDPLGGAA